MLGGAVGMLMSGTTCRWLAIKSVELLRQITNGALGIELDLSPNWRVFGWTLGVSLLTGIGIAIVPAMRAASRDLNSTLKQGTPGSGDDAEAARSRNLLLAIQVASCLILLAGAGFLFRGALRSEHIRPGFEYQHLAILGIDTQGAAASSTSRLDVLRQAVRRMEAIPSIASVAWADRVPFLGTGTSTFENERGASLGCVFNGVSDEYFATVGIRLLAGRTFRREEIDNDAPIAVISESTARKLWPGQSPIGQRIVPGTKWLRDAIGRRPSLTVVGVVQSIRSTYLSKDDAGYMYMPRRLHAGGTLFLIRTRIAPDRTFKSLATTLAEISPQLAARAFMSTMEQGPVRMQELMAQAPATVAFILGFIALLLACIGIYGVVSHYVARRTREIGIRIALGAASWDLITAVFGQTLRPV
jgi:predicted permease